MYTLNTIERHSVCYGISRDAFNLGENGGGMSILENVQPNMMSNSPGAVCYALYAYGSNAWRSSNPHSGIYETDVVKTLDQNGSNPSCHQGGTVICYAPESCNCTSYRESETAATMITGYHYGGGATRH